MKTNLFNLFAVVGLIGILLLSIFACEQKEVINQHQAVAPVTQEISTLTDAEFTSVLNTLDEAFGQLSRTSILSDIGLKKNELTGEYEVNTVVFDEALQDDSKLDLFLSEVDDLIESAPEYEWIGTYINSNISPDLAVAEENAIDLRGRKPYCCLICCQAYSTTRIMVPMYLKTKMRRSVGARLWCWFHLIRLSIQNQINGPCADYLNQRECGPEDQCVN